MTRMFALRRKSDGVFMPDYKGRAGGTYVDPADPSTHTGTPRIFTTQVAAGNALRWWSKGHVKQEYSGPGDPMDIFSGPEPTGLSQTPVAGRDAADWEIVPVALVEVKA